MSGPDPTLSQERAQAVWRRAARLQAEAERRMEERTRLLAAGEGPEGGAAAAEGGLPAREVEAAAVEAGIAPEYVRIAMAEVAASEPAPAPMRAWEERAATRFLGTPDRSLELVRVVAGTPPRVVEAALRVLPGHPCLLQVREVVDLPSLPGRAAVFDVPRYDWSATSNPAFVENAAMISLRRVHFTVRALPGGRPTCEVVVSGDLERGVRTSWRLGALSSLGLGTSGAVAGLLIAPPAAALALAGGLAAALWGPTYRYYRRRVEAALEEGLRALEASLRADPEPRALSTGEE